MEKQQYESKIPSSRPSSRKIREISPYSKNFKCYIKSDERDLVYKRQLVTKLTRKDLEDRYIELCDENFFLKRQHNENEDKIKILTSRIGRLSECHRSLSSSAILKENTIKRKFIGKGVSENCTERGEKAIARASSLHTIFKRNGKQIPSSSSSTSRSVKIEAIEKGIQEPSEKSHIQDKEFFSLKEKVNSIEKELEQEKEHSDKIKRENMALEQRLSEIDLKKFLIENIEVNRLKRKLEHFREVVRKLREHNHKIAHNKALQIQAIKMENYEITKQLKEEFAKNSALTEKLDELNSSFRTIDALKKQISELEYDKKSLFEQQENLSTLVKETASYKQTKIEASSLLDLQEILEKMEHLETENAAIDNSKNELLSKIRLLQDLNDKLMVDLEGYKAEKHFQMEVYEFSEQENVNKYECVQ